VTAIHSERGEVSLEHLTTLPTPDIKRHLLKYPGIGEKTVACVLMYYLLRPGMSRHDATAAAACRSELSFRD